MLENEELGHEWWSESAAQDIGPNLSYPSTIRKKEKLRKNKISPLPPSA